MTTHMGYLNCTPCQGQIEFVGPRLLDSLKMGDTSESDKPTTRYPHDGQDPFVGTHATALTWQDAFSYWGLQRVLALRERVLPESFR